MLYGTWMLNTEAYPKINHLKPVGCPKGHLKHPILVWIAYSKANFKFAVKYGIQICKEYTRRYEREHVYEKHLRALEVLGYPPKQKTKSENVQLGKRKVRETIFSEVGFPARCTAFPLCFGKDDPDRFYQYNADGKLSAKLSYREYYRNKKTSMKRPMKYYKNALKGNKSVPKWLRKKHKTKTEVEYK